MYVVKRDGRKEPVKFDKITARINKLSYGLNTQFCDPVSARLQRAVAKRTLQAFYLPMAVLCAGAGRPEGGHGRLQGRNNKRAR
jgi:hypothetical protein